MNCKSTAIPFYYGVAVFSYLMYRKGGSSYEKKKLKKCLLNNFRHVILLDVALRITFLEAEDAEKKIKKRFDKKATGMI